MISWRTIRCSVPLFSLVLLCFAGCGGGGGGGDDNGGTAVINTSGQYAVFAWNDLGMHCLNPTYDTAVLLPPYNTVWAQVVRRASTPQLVTTGITVDYRIVNNTTSYNKTDTAFGAVFAQFWDNALALFGVALTHDTGLNLADPNLHNGLTGTMVVAGNHFVVNGIPLTPVDDNGVWNPYQVVEVTVRENGTNTILARTRATVPTSDEIHCDKCHGAAAPFLDMLQKHDTDQGTTLVASRPVLCAGCHGSPALGANGPGSSGLYLSAAIHGFHAGKTTPANAPIACYDCHPGTTSQCNRSLAHTAADGNCTNGNCHGSMTQVASSIASGRVPWVSEPQCRTCHTTVAGADTGAALYRDASGHGGLGCPACHGSPHAMVPSRVASDNYQALQYQSRALAIGSCRVCHGSSQGGGSGEFLEEHGAGGRPSACNVCHTAVPSGNTAEWPHRFQF